MTHHHPHGKDIPSPRSSELFASITDEAVAQFFRLQGKRRIEKEYWLMTHQHFQLFGNA